MEGLKERLKKLSSKDLEIFVRQRLGQKDAIFCIGSQEHKRLSFHSATSKDLINNMELISEFDDIWDAGDHDHTPIITGYKGGLNVGSTNYLNDGLYPGWTTVDVICDIIKKWVGGERPSFNGFYKAEKNDS